MTQNRAVLTYLSMDSDKLLRAAGPGGQDDVTKSGPILQGAQVIPVGVFKHLRQVEELGDELLHVCRAAHTAGPGRFDGVEEAVGVIEFSSLRAKKREFKNSFIPLVRENCVQQPVFYMFPPSHIERGLQLMYTYHCHPCSSYLHETACLPALHGVRAIQISCDIERKLYLHRYPILPCVRTAIFGS